MMMYRKQTLLKSESSGSSKNILAISESVPRIRERYGIIMRGGEEKEAWRNAPAQEGGWVKNSLVGVGRGEVLIDRTVEKEEGVSVIERPLDGSPLFHAPATCQSPAWETLATDLPRQPPRMHLASRCRHITGPRKSRSHTALSAARLPALRRKTARDITGGETVSAVARGDALPPQIGSATDAPSDLSVTRRSPTGDLAPAADREFLGGARGAGSDRLLYSPTCQLPTPLGGSPRLHLRRVSERILVKISRLFGWESLTQQAHMRQMPFDFPRGHSQRAPSRKKVGGLSCHGKNNFRR
ncbi:hypothetical protein SKAU_G00103730 [Synaphobranchus kaupii]|uniref:Uncharacterized protein n=1 Tax=Synaphobranchus kaupii TaxID=118154 RepID=A0A9Q1FZZ0_SYNKA|nr:hypothetical protein SKAU_G00103730 [Synaphobranchus kaupii]